MIKCLCGKEILNDDPHCSFEEECECGIVISIYNVQEPMEKISSVSKDDLEMTSLLNELEFNNPTNEVKRVLRHMLDNYMIDNSFVSIVNEVLDSESRAGE